MPDDQCQTNHQRFTGTKDSSKPIRMLCARCLRGIAKSARRQDALRTPRWSQNATPQRLHLAPCRLNYQTDLAPLQDISGPHLPGPHSLSHLRAPFVASESLSATTSLATTTALPWISSKISTHPALAGIQVRNGPRNTYDPSHRVRKRRHGFLARKKSRTGRAILVRRRVKKRSTLSH
jgi:large subunit ribosomal protein L34